MKRLSGLAKLAVVCGLLLSAYNYCPPGAEASITAKTPDCCQTAKASSKHCPAKPKKQASQRSCCTQASIAAASLHIQAAFTPLVFQDVSAVAAAPQIVAYRLAHSLIRPAGPPGCSPAVLGNRAPPLA